MANKQAYVNYSAKLSPISNSDTLTVGSGITTLSGDLTLGSNSGNIFFDGVITSDITFDNNAHTLSATGAAATVPGADLIVVAATGGLALVGSPGGTGGTLTNQGGAGGAASTGSGAGGPGGPGIFQAGPGGAGTATGQAGPGGQTSLLGGNAGSDGGAGGNNGGGLVIDAGVASSGGTNGTIALGVDFATGLTIANSACITDFNGTFNFTGTIASNLPLSGSSPAIFPTVPSGVGTPGEDLSLFSGNGADGDLGTPGGAAGTLGLFGNHGGAGSSSQVAGNGGDINLVSGDGGTDGGAGGANSGDLFLDVGGATGAGTLGGIFIGQTTATNIVIGNSGSTLTIHGMVVFDNPPSGSAAQLLSAAPVYACPSGAVVGNVVYVSAGDTVALADATNSAKMPVAGVVASKPSSTTCTLTYYGEQPSLSGLTAGATYYADPSTPGAITSTAPSTSGNIVQKIGVARNTTTLLVELGDIRIVL